MILWPWSLWSSFSTCISSNLQKIVFFFLKFLCFISQTHQCPLLHYFVVIYIYFNIYQNCAHEMYMYMACFYLCIFFGIISHDFIRRLLNFVPYNVLSLVQINSFHFNLINCKNKLVYANHSDPIFSLHLLPNIFRNALK